MVASTTPLVITEKSFMLRAWLLRDTSNAGHVSRVPSHVGFEACLDRRSSSSSVSLSQNRYHGDRHWTCVLTTCQETLTDTDTSNNNNIAGTRRNNNQTLIGAQTSTPPWCQPTPSCVCPRPGNRPDTHELHRSMYLDALTTRCRARMCKAITRPCAQRESESRLRWSRP